MWMYKVAYDGTKFFGSQIQSNEITVEGELEKIIGLRCKLISRTDRGVSALCNILMMKERINIGEVNSQLRHIVLWAEIEVKKLSEVKYRHYRYFLIGYNKKQIESLKQFKGTHDFSKFTKSRKNTIRTVDIKIGKQEKVFYVDFFSKGFLWNQIRRMVGTLGTQKAPPEPLILLNIVFQDELKWKEYKYGLKHFKRSNLKAKNSALVLDEMIRV